MHDANKSPHKDSKGGADPRIKELQGEGLFQLGQWEASSMQDANAKKDGMSLPNTVNPLVTS